VSLPREAQLEVMALADGELEGDERQRVERLVADDEEARRLFEAMRSPLLAMWVNEATREQSGAAAGIADNVMARLSVRPDQAQGGVVRRAPSDDRGDRTERAGRAGRARARGPVRFAAVVGALALAAGVALYARTMVEPPGSRYSPVASVQPPGANVPGATEVPAVSAPPRIEGAPPSTAPSAVARAPGATPPGVEVTDIDSPLRRVSVFEIPIGNAAAMAGSAGPSSVVVWIDDDRGSK
jgi:hypothetical protein